jgi:hypothetical protein
MNRRISVNTGLAVPQSFVTKGKQRLKQHVNAVYLNNGDEFEIELYNPKINKVLAKIELNGNFIGNGIVLRPGERVFLERYLDVAKKFKFETYIVNGEDKQVKNAISNNGDVTVRFYDEYIQPLTGGITWTNYPSTLLYNSGTPPISNFGTYTTPNICTYTTSGNQFFSKTKDVVFNDVVSNIDSHLSFTKSLKKQSVKSKILETGRVEKGSNSNQSFDYDNTTFNLYVSEVNIWKIKPQSTKPVVIEDLITYCSECGSKRKKDTHKFCPNCGTKY